MRRSASIAEVSRKYEELNRSLLAHQISSGLFGLLALIMVPTSLFAPDPESVLVALFSSLIFMQALKGKRELKSFKAEFQKDPKSYARRRIPKPIMYYVYFWYLPR